MEAEKNVRDFGAVGDGKADDTLSLRAALEAAAARGGGVVRVGAGTYRTGPLTLESGVELRVDAGAVLSFIPEFERYEPVRSRWEGVECWCMRPLLFARDARNVALTGGGTLDGNGAVWWNAYRAIRASGRKRPETDQELELARLNPDYLSQPSGGGGRETQFLRPPMVHFLDCRDVRIENVRLMNTPYWNTHLVYCRGIVVRGVLFRNPYDAPNTDGMNLDSCVDALVEDSEFDVGDDCLGLKSGSGEDGVRVGRPTERVTIRGCLMRAGHGGVVVGSETAGGVRDVSVSGCRFQGTDRGLRIKTRRGRGGTVENIALSDCEMEDTLCPVVVNCYYGPGGPSPDSPVFSLESQPAMPTTPKIRGIVVERLRATGCRSAAAFAVGLPESPIEGLSIIDSSFDLARPPTAPVEEAAMTRGLPTPAGRGIRLRNAVDVRLVGVQVFPEEERTFVLEPGVEFREFAS
jgi:polygalacturonase